jgi:hypothetical protein
LKITVGTVDPNINVKRDVVLVRGGKRQDVQQKNTGASTDFRGKLQLADDRSNDKVYTVKRFPSTSRTLTSRMYFVCSLKSAA